MSRASCLYEGRVRHRRFEPSPHEFSYRLSLLYIDLDELPDLFRGRWLWSNERRTLASFRRADHLGDPRLPLKDAVVQLVEERTGQTINGPIRLLTHPRYYGYGFNPVSFFYCFDEADSRVEAIVAEVSNTPWGERHCYVLTESANRGSKRKMRYRFPKSFHVSPFLDMDYEYDWRFLAPGERLAVHMDNLTGAEKTFDATMNLRRREIGGVSLARALTRYPFMTGKVVGAIYFEALRLRLKGTPFFSRPRHGEAVPSTRCETR
jgi:DUF1365 family protein